MNKLIIFRIDYLISLGLILTFFCFSCKSSTDVESLPTPIIENTIANIEEKPEIDYDITQWKEIINNKRLLLDIRYATDNNFTEAQIYECARCFLRPELAAKINRIHNDIQEKYGYGLKMFDCYRPRPAQQKLWDIVPNAMYVTPPKKGSMHNRGLAVDLTLVDKNGEELDMGTEYDFFGKEAHRTYDHPNPIVRKNRKLLKLLMETHGLTGIRTEWWHYSLKTVSYDFSDWEWPCS